MYKATRDITNADLFGMFLEKGKSADEVRVLAGTLGICTEKSNYSVGILFEGQDNSWSFPNGVDCIEEVTDKAAE